MQGAVSSSYFQDHGIAAGKAAVQVLHKGTSGAPRMRGDLAPTTLKHGSHFHEFSQASCKSAVRLPNVKAVALHKNPPLIARRQAFTTSNRNGSALTQLGITPGI